MNIQEAKQEIKNTVRAYLKRNEAGFFEIPVMRQRPVLLMGAPGVGKTAIMRQIAEEEGIGFVSYNMTHHTRQSALGLPLIRKEEYDGSERDVTAYTMSEIVSSVYDLMKRTGLKEGILFLDEINCVSETLAPVILQLLQAKQFGRENVPEGWILVAAGNPAEYNRSVREFDMATLDRVRLIEIEPDLEAWRTYAAGAGVHGAVLSYLNIHKENFYKAYITADGMSFVTARGWEDLSGLLKTYESLGINADIPQILQFVRDRAVAADFAAFYEMYKRYENAYMIDDILAGKASDAVKERMRGADLDEKIGVIGLLTARLNTAFKEFTLKRMATDRLYAMVKTAGDDKNTPQAEETAPPDTLLCPELAEGSMSKRTALTAFGNEIRQLKEELLTGRGAGLMSDDTARALQSCVNVADAWISAGKADDIEKLRKTFLAYSGTTDGEADGIRTMLDHIYDFLEGTKTDGTELVLFTTELASGKCSLEFIREEGYERFYVYNKALLDSL